MISQEQQKKEMIGWVSIMTLLVMLIWMIAGIAAFIMSIVCFSRSGTPSQHIIGLLIALILGPFYWIYYVLARGYCKTL